MEIESEGGERILIAADSEAELGRRLGIRGLSAGDRTVSRRHLSLRLLGELDDDDPRGGLRVSFEVVGRNPILVRAAGEGADATRVYRHSEKGELRNGDRFSLSLKNPSFLVVKRSEGGGKEEVDGSVLDAVRRREKRTQERRMEKEKEKERLMAKADEIGDGEEDEETADGELELDMGGLDISSIDPVQEFGFLVEGHEFDHYPRQKIRPPEKWNWFLDELRRQSDGEDEFTDEEGTSLQRKNQRIKKKRGEENEVEEWTGESEDEKGKVGEANNVRKSKYSTRSQDLKRSRKDDTSGKRKSLEGRDLNNEKDGNDEEEETLGGFIVDGEEEEAEVEDMDEEEEEEEFDEEEDDDY